MVTPHIVVEMDYKLIPAHFLPFKLEVSLIEPYTTK